MHNPWFFVCYLLNFDWYRWVFTNSVMSYFQRETLCCMAMIDVLGRLCSQFCTWRNECGGVRCGWRSRPSHHWTYPLCELHHQSSSTSSQYVSLTPQTRLPLHKQTALTNTTHRYRYLHRYIHRHIPQEQLPLWIQIPWHAQLHTDMPTGTATPMETNSHRHRHAYWTQTPTGTYAGTTHSIDIDTPTYTPTGSDTPTVSDTPQRQTP